jgi:hypothetical protein
MHGLALQPGEQELRERLDALGADARACARHAFTGLSINYVASTRPELIAKLDANAGFWNPVIDALQNSSIVAMGRIFDRRRDVRSAEKLLTHATTSIGLFGRQSLELRKARNMSPALARDFAAAAFHPTPQDFAGLKTEVDNHRALYDLRIAPIRNNVSAHSGRITTQQMYQLFGSVPVVDFERLVVFPLRLHSALWQLFENGLRPELPPTPVHMDELAASPIGRSTSSLEHRHAYKDAQGFLEWLVSARAPDS